MNPQLTNLLAAGADQYRVLGWIVLLPLIGAVINGFFGKKIGRDGVYIVGVATVAFSFLLSLFAFAALVKAGHSLHVEDGEPAHAQLSYLAWEWFDAPIGSSAHVALKFRYVLDSLSGVMLLVVTGVGTLIHVYSTGYMSHDAGYARFFAYLNLFMFSMLNLILADSLPLLFVGWEGVGLCSYLLIGFWYTNSQYASAGKKAFIVNRIGDVGVILGIAILAYKGGAYNFSDLHEALHPAGGGTSVTMTALSTPTELNDFIASFFAFPNFTGLHDAVFRSVPTFTWGGLACLLLFIGCTGKSAQLPLYVWLPDAMAGPTPVSALIHAATMVTAGVYLLCRMSFLYVHFPTVMEIIAITGALTALFAATIALAQNELKKILAYSTVSQLGFMFLACGVGAFSAGLFHVYTHAMFKACLFLSAGAIMHACRDKQDVRELGGLRKYMPLTYIAFGLATLAIAGMPLFSGFFSKDEILFRAFASAHRIDPRIVAAAPKLIAALVLLAAAGRAWPGLILALVALGVGIGIGIAVPMAGGAFVGIAALILLVTIVVGFVRLGLKATIGGLAAILITVLLARIASGHNVGAMTFVIGVIAATLTAFYMFRALFLTFWGDFKGWSLEPVKAGISPKVEPGKLQREPEPANEPHGDAHDAHDHDDHGHSEGNPWDPPKDNPWNMTGVILALGVLSVLAGYIGLPFAWTHHESTIEHFLEPSVSEWHVNHLAAHAREILGMVLGITAFAIGAGAAAWVYVLQGGEPAKRLVSAAGMRDVYRLVTDKWRIDELYDVAIVRPLAAISDFAASIVDIWFIDLLVRMAGWIARLAGSLLRKIQTGTVHVYATVLMVGALAILGWSIASPSATIGYRAEGNHIFLQAYGGLGYSYEWDLHGDGNFQVCSADIPSSACNPQQDTTCTPIDLPDGRRVCRVGLRVHNAFGYTATVTRTIEIRSGEMQEHH